MRSAADNFDPWQYVPSASDPPFCAPPNAPPLDAVLGVITTQQSSWRESVRSSFFRFASEPGLLLRIVLRGINASQLVREEFVRHGDTIFLRAPASLSAGRGPLTSTLLWLSCAVDAWPNARHIGKAEDDTWLHLPDIMSSLRVSRDALAARNVHELYWGHVQSYYWNETAQRPFAFGHSFGEGTCVVNATGNTTSSRGRFRLNSHAVQHGPFSFACGQLYFLSRGVTSQLVNDAPTRRRAAAALGTADTARSGGPAGVDRWRAGQVWEDVWIGYALSQLRPSPSLGVVRLSSNMFWETWGFAAMPSTIVWHAKTKDPRRPPRLHEYMVTLQQHCNRRPSAPVQCRDHQSRGAVASEKKTAGSCTGGEWVFCVDDAFDGRCPRPARGPVDLNNRTTWARLQLARSRHRLAL